MRPTVLQTTDSVPALNIRDAFAGKHLLVTGVTGFLGKVWIVSLLRELPNLGRISVLVRPNRGATAVQRLQAMLTVSPAVRPLREALGDAATAQLFRDKIEVLSGDVSLPLCDLDEHTIERLASSVDLVVNFAGITDFQPDPSQAIAINTRGAEHVADVCARMDRAKLLHVSTAYVAGCADGRVAEALDHAVSPNGRDFDVAHEVRSIEATMATFAKGRAGSVDRIDAAQKAAQAMGWPNIYTWSKALAERLLMARDDIELCVVRPSIVECARAQPFEGWNEGLNTSGPLAWLISTAFREFPSKANNHFDIAPVDLVCRGTTLIAAAAFEDRASGVYHLGTSGSNPVSFGRIIELTGLANRRRLKSSATASPWERLVVRHLDPVPVDADAQPLWHVSRVRRGARSVQKLLRKQDTSGWPELLRQPADKAIKRGVKRSNEAVRSLGRIEKMLELYRPFVHDYDYIFANDRVRALSNALPDDQRADFRYDDDTIDWRDYWYNVQYPGLYKWSIPILNGGAVPSDPPMNPAVELRAALTTSSNPITTSSVGRLEHRGT